MFRQDDYHTYRYFNPGINIRRSHQPRISLSNLRSELDSRAWSSAERNQDYPLPEYYTKSKKELQDTLEGLPVALRTEEGTVEFDSVPAIDTVYPVIRFFTKEVRHFAFEKVQFSGTITYKSKSLFFDESDLPVIEGVERHELVFHYFVRFPYSLPVASKLYGPEYVDRDLIFDLYKFEHRFDTYLCTGVRNYLPGDYSISPQWFYTTYRQPSKYRLELLPLLQLNSKETEVEVRYDEIFLKGVDRPAVEIFKQWRTAFNSFTAVERKNKFPRDLSVASISPENKDFFIYGIDEEEFYHKFVATGDQGTEFIDEDSVSPSSLAEYQYMSELDSDFIDSSDEDSEFDFDYDIDSDDCREIDLTQSGSTDNN
jgi:hypothetical protein